MLELNQLLIILREKCVIVIEFGYSWRMQGKINTIGFWIWLFHTTITINYLVFFFLIQYAHAKCHNIGGKIVDNALSALAIGDLLNKFTVSLIINQLEFNTDWNHFWFVEVQKPDYSFYVNGLCDILFRLVRRIKRIISLNSVKSCV